MSDKTNDEKLRILQERLAQIKGKQEAPAPRHKQQEKVTEIATPEVKEPTKNKKSFYSSWISKVILVGAVAYGLFYTYNNINTKEPLPKNSKKEDTRINISTKLKYKLNFDGDNIAIITSFEDENSAKALVNDLKIKGFKTNYLFLPNKSNSTEKIYQVFIGPYENEKETSQWIENIEKEVTIIKLSNGNVLRKMKSKKLKEKEKAEKKRIAKEQAEKEKIAKEQEKIAKEKAEKEKIAKEQEEIAKEQAEKEKIAEEQEKIAKEEAEKEALQLVQQELEDAKEKLKKEIEQLKKNKKTILINSPEITISYTYKFTSTIQDKGLLIIDNNAGYPVIKQKFANIKSQGGVEKIIENAKYDMNTYGALLNGIYFERSGSIVSGYKGDITEVSW